MGNSCVYDGKTYSEGSVVCMNGWEYRCNDGSWDSLGTSCGNESYYSIQDGQLVASKPSPEMGLACLSFFAAGVGRVGIRNNCSTCKQAVVNWSTIGVKKYPVQAYDQIVIDMESSTGQLIGEDPC
ncbi:MAG: DUF1496 domain-containing protein [Candidatus Kapabacteria bacterium]|nr:DUF1496 domain-containing protein [Candidatus Kapabacteria bacterium]